MFQRRFPKNFTKGKIKTKSSRRWTVRKRELRSEYAAYGQLKEFWDAFSRKKALRLASILVAGIYKKTPQTNIVRSVLYTG